MTDERTTNAFPAGFLWGAATSSYQIEGAAFEDGKGESIWDRFSHTRGKVANDDTGDVACDHYHRWPDDIAIMSELGLQAYRFSIAWPRILPNGTGAINDAGLEFYDRLTDGLLEAGIEPWVTLYHWDLPQVLEDAGGWTNRATAEAFVEFADAVARRLGDRVKRWITINEPWVIAVLGYLWGMHAPGRTDPWAAMAATHHVLLAHGLAVPVIRAASAGAQVGITLNLTPMYAVTNSEEDLAAAWRADGESNRMFLDPVAGRGYPEDILSTLDVDLSMIASGDLDTIAVPTDFMGINYYQPGFMVAAAEEPSGRIERPPANTPRTGMDWLVWPNGLRDLLVRLQTDYSHLGPFLVTENGAAYPDTVEDGQIHDRERLAFIHAHLAACQEAIERGVPLAGYFVWSLLDNFEWAFGYSQRFGVVRVDFETLERTIKDSGRWYAQVTRANSLIPPPF